MIIHEADKASITVRRGGGKPVFEATWVLVNLAKMMRTARDTLASKKDCIVQKGGS